jgi:hypothetical protein
MAGDSGARFSGTFHNAIVFNTRHPEILSQHSPPQDDNASRQRAVPRPALPLSRLFS